MAQQRLPRGTQRHDYMLLVQESVMQEIDSAILKNSLGLKLMDYVHPNEVVRDDRPHDRRLADVVDRAERSLERGRDVAGLARRRQRDARRGW